MKKLKLLFAACALMLGVSNVMAQKDVTSQYITNATLSNGLTGWTPTNFNTPQRGNNTVGYASEAYAGWGGLDITNYSLTQTITLPAGHYTLVNYSFFRQGQNADTDASKSLAYLKAGDNQVAIKTLGSITAAGYANNQSDGANCFDSKMYRNTLDFTIDADNTQIEIGIVGTFDEMRSWCIAGMFELIDLDTEATMDSPFDVTGYITNSGFEYRDMSGWTLNGEFGAQGNNQSFKVGGYYAEKWQSAASGALSARSMSQTLTGLPAGFYKLTANLGGDGTYVDVNGKTVNWTADKDYTVGYVLSENEPLVITAGKTEEGTANWIHFDNFRLQFCGDVAAALTTLIAELPKYEGTIPSAAYSALVTAVSAYDKSYSDVDELIAAISAVQNLYNDADLLVAPYNTAKSLLATASGLTANYPNLNAIVVNSSMIIETFTTVDEFELFNSSYATANNILSEWLNMKGKADVLVAVPNDNSEANAALSGAIATFDANVQNVTDISEGLAIISASTAGVKDAMSTYVFAANPVGDDARFDCTFLMTNPDLTGLPTWQPAAGWASEETDGNSQVMVNDSKTVGDKSYFYEYWSNPAKASGKFALYNAVTLPAGTFAMSCYAFAENQYAENTFDGVYFYANDTQGSCVTATVLTPQNLSFVNNAEQEVKIGLKTLTGNTRNWMGIGYVELYKVPAQVYVVSENATYDNSQEGAGAVNLTRNIKVGYNTLVLPFSMTQAEVEEQFGEGSVVYDLNSIEGDVWHFEAYDGISANRPCILKATKAGSSYNLEDRSLVSGAPEHNVVGGGMTGSYAASLTVPEGNYIISGDKLYYVDSEVTIKGTRAYFNSTIDSGSRTAILSFDGVTGIATVENGELKSVEIGTIYDLSGREVKKPVKGKVFIVNGKKVVF